jgi:hypothetical protein
MNHMCAIFCPPMEEGQMVVKKFETKDSSRRRPRVAKQNTWCPRSEQKQQQPEC